MAEATELLQSVGRARAPRGLDTEERSELERLRAEVEALKRGKLPSVPGTGAPGTFKVRLPGLRPLLSEVIVTARYPQGIIPRVVGPGAVVPEKYRTLAPGSYNGWELFLTTGDPDLQRAARRRYQAEQKLEDHEMMWVRVRTEKRSQVDHLEIPAQSPADALALFYKYCGVSATNQIPVVERLENGQT